MAYSFQVGESSYLHQVLDFFVESRNGLFDGFCSNETKYFTYDGTSSARVVGVDNGSYGSASICFTYYINATEYPRTYRPTSTSVVSANNNYWICAYQAQVSTGYGSSVTIIDEHGSHYGNANCVNAKFGSVYTDMFGTRQACSSSVGVKHRSTNTGHVFKGWKVKKSDTITLLSTGYQEFQDWDGGKIYYFPPEYSGAIVAQLHSDSNSSIVIEAIYDYDVVQRTISFDTDGGLPLIDSVKILTGSTMTLPSAPTKEGYLFVGWKSGATGITYLALDQYTAEDYDDTFVAQWEYIPPAVYIISFDTDGGVPQYESISGEEGHSFTIPDLIPSKTGFIFTGWKSSNTSAIYKAGDVYVIASYDDILKAQWFSPYRISQIFATGNLFDIFVEESSGMFTGLVTSEDGNKIINYEDISVSSMTAAIVAVSNTEVRTSTHGNGYISSSSTVSLQRYGSSDINHIAGPSLGWTPVNPTGPMVSVYDNYGTHYGSGNGSYKRASLYNFPIGVKHKETTDRKYIFKGWRVTNNSNSVMLSTGWTEKNGNTYFFDENYDGAIVLYASITDIYGSVEFTALYDINPLLRTLWFDLDGGSPQIDSMEDIEGYSVVLPTTVPTKQGFSFLYWESRLDGERYNPGDVYTFKWDNDILIAKWKEPTPPTPSRKIKNKSRGRLLHYKSGMLIYSNSGSLVF